MISFHHELKYVAPSLKCNRSAVLQMRERGLFAIPAKLDKSPYVRFPDRGSKHTVCEQADDKADAVLLNGYQ